MSEKRTKGDGVMHGVEGDFQSANLRGQRSRAPQLSPELTELMHMLDSLEDHFVARTSDSED
jgi:hypothetical protein